MVTKIIITREQAPDAALRKKLENKPFELIHLPLICCRPRPLPAAIEKLLPLADWVFFTSAVAVDFFSPYLPAGCRIACIGPQTSQAVRKQGWEPAFEADSHYAADFVREWLELALPAQKILLPQSSLSNPLMAEQLREKGQEVWAWPLYDTLPAPAGQAQIDAYLSEAEVVWTFASPSAWQSFYEKPPILPAQHKIAVIGTSTAKAVSESGCQVDIMPQTPSVGQMIEEIIRNETE